MKYLELFDLTGRTAIVTGGSRGIGFALAKGLAASGANVMVASRKADARDRATAEMTALGQSALSVPTHVGDLDALDTLVSRTVDAFGGVDIVINNAAHVGLPSRGTGPSKRPSLRSRWAEPEGGA
jgi:NAD(P)-dependent dehydrogenase (short-subunit alcohol dehydrogenase family)